VHTQEINEYPEDVKEEFLRVSGWIRAVHSRYGNRVMIRLIDPQSPSGIWKVLRHRIRRFPAFLVDGTEWILGWEGNPDGAVSQAVAGRGTTEVEA
jgi:hypothetical protein